LGTTLLDGHGNICNIRE